MEKLLIPKTIKNTTKNQVGNNWHLLLWNDDVNDMLDVIQAIYSVCKLSKQQAVKIMKEAHEKGQAFAKAGNRKELEAMQQALSQRNIGASVVREDIDNS